MEQVNNTAERYKTRWETLHGGLARLAESASDQNKV